MDDDLRSLLVESARAIEAPASDVEDAIRGGSRRKAFMATISLMTLSAVGLGGWGLAASIDRGPGRENPIPAASSSGSAEHNAVCATQPRTFDAAVFIRDDMTTEQTQALRTLLEDDDGVIYYRFISKEEGFQRYKAIYEMAPQLWESLPHDALPAWFGIRTRTPGDASALVTQVQDLPGVDVARTGELMRSQVDEMYPDGNDPCGPNWIPPTPGETQSPTVQESNS
ncbi:MAG: FtsX extracellular domain [Actinomycetota bacterium]|jgi:hypothetical protein|nr:FtsX extracellular domain [Actinomycetota bacterium]